MAKRKRNPSSSDPPADNRVNSESERSTANPPRPNRLLLAGSVILFVLWLAYLTSVAFRAN